MPPASNNVIGIGETPERMPKVQNSGCRIKLVDEHDHEVPDGDPGELAIRSPTLFSGYWNAPETNAKDFRGGWFHMGDMFARAPDGSLDFVDRRKYLIKSGGENIYPAEIERVLLADARIGDAVVVRTQDDKWGEVPVAFVVRRDATLTEADVVACCNGKIARYKLPKEVRFVTDADLPRSATGKIKRYELEAVLKRP
jgi:fatty-acyl-CoA synthase